MVNNMIVLVTGQHQSGSSSSLATQEISTCKGVPSVDGLGCKIGSHIRSCW